MAPSDADWWRIHRARLYSESVQNLAAEVDRYFGDGLTGVETALIAEIDERRVGFAELSVRAYAEGCRSENVAYLEGWYVVEGRRGRHVGLALVEAAEAWGRSRGCRELASDTRPDNRGSIDAHLACGFEDAGIVRAFRKSLER
jgi:aminoglycoside 6'-N-acetyltransferase I